MVGNDFVVRPSNSANIKFQNNGASNLMVLNNSGNVSIGNTNDVSKLDVSGQGIFRNDDALLLYNSGGNCNFKQQGGSYIKRLEQQSGGNYYMWDEGNNEVYHISTDRQMWWQGDFNVAGTYYDSGIPIVPSSIKLKSNITDLTDDNKILDKIKFKKYTKTYKNKTYDEIGIVIEDLEQIEGIEKYNLIHTRESNEEEFNNLKYLKYVPFFMVLFKK